METTAVPPEQAPARANAGVALGSVFFSPTRSFQEISRGASWLWGFLASVALSLVAGIVQSPFTRAVSRAQLAKLPDAQREAAERTLGVQSTMQIVVAPVGVAIALLVGSLVFLAILRVMGLRLRFKAVFTGLCYTGLITGVGGLVYAFLNRRVAVAGEVTGVQDMPRMGLDLLVSGSEGYVRGLLSMFSVFSVWWLVAMVYGFAVLAGRTPRQTAPAVVVAGVLWLLLSGLMIGFALAAGSP